MTDNFNLPPRAEFRDHSPLLWRMFVNLALYMIFVPAFFAAMSPARGAQVEPKPKPVQPQPKIEIIPDTRPVPTHTGHVNDTANILKAEERERIEKALAEYERETFHQIAVLTIPTLAGADIEAYSVRVYKAWKLGQNGIGDGILMTIAMNDRIVRIQPGPVMEKYISEDDASAVVEEHIIPAFKRGDYSRGVQAGVIEMMRLGRRLVVKKEDIERAKRK